MLHKEIVLEQTVSYLRSNLYNVLLPQYSVRIMVDEQVPPNAGAEFIAVRGSTVESITEPSVLAKQIEYGITISVTVRMEGAANEHAGEHVLTDTWLNRLKPSLEARVAEVVNLIDSNWELMNLINSLIPKGCFLTPFGFISETAEPEKLYAESFDIEEDPLSLRYVGLRTDLEFGGAEFYVSR